MQIEVLKSKLHCVTVTDANLQYMGSITIDEDLMDAANLIAGEKVQIVDNNNGERFETYIIKGERGSGSPMPSWTLRRPSTTSPSWCSPRKAISYKSLTPFPLSEGEGSGYL